MVHRSIAGAQARRTIAEPVKPAIIERDEIGLEHCRQRFADNLDRSRHERTAIGIVVPQSVGISQRQRRNAPQRRLQGGIDRVTADPRRNRRPTPRKSAQVQILTHPRTIVHRIIVPQTDLAPEPVRDIAQVTGRIVGRAHFLARPVDLNRRIDQPTEILEIAGRARAKDTVEQRIIRIIARARKEARGAAVIKAEGDDLGLAHREIGQITAHIVKQDGEIVEAERIERRELCLQRGAGVSIEIEMRAIRRKPDAKADAKCAAMRRKMAKIVQCAVGMQQSPVAAQEGVDLGRVMEEAIARRTNAADDIAPIHMRPAAPKIAFDNAEFRDHV